MQQSPTKPDHVPLPTLRAHGNVTLADAIGRRRSVRDFAKIRLTPVQVGRLCWAAQGITDKANGLRAAPSAGALYPAVLFVADADGVYEYAPSTHTLRRRGAGDRRPALRAAALDQSCVGDAPACFIVTVAVERTARKYGGWANRYCLMEAGHIAQNLLLQAVALGLGGVPVGAFDEAEVAKTLNLKSRLEPVYLVPLGHPAGER